MISQPRAHAMPLALNPAMYSDLTAKVDRGGIAGAGSSPLAPSGMTISCWMFESVAYTASSVATMSLMNPEFEGVGLEQLPGRGVVDADGWLPPPATHKRSWASS